MLGRRLTSKGNRRLIPISHGLGREARRVKGHARRPRTLIGPGAYRGRVCLPWQAATAAQVNAPTGIAVDSATPANVYFTDRFGLIRKITPNPTK